MTINGMEGYSDLIYMEKFEGIKQNVDWTTQEWSDILLQLKGALENVYNK